ncbi:MAG TPA: methyltransferase domain-containing protein [Gemmatimonadaceae bacterium]|nr:methyltransferase domain-containing protein [Gemmatimonadaceae bacterium]
MSSWSEALAPERRRGVELLDDPQIDAAVRERSIIDVTRSNRWLGGLRAASAALRDALRDAMRSVLDETAGARRALTLLDVGTGLADIPQSARAVARALGIELFTVGVDEASSLLVAARSAIDAGVCADALALPFADGAVDVVICSQLLHHFVDADAARLVNELNRVARRAVVVSDLRRSWVAAAGFWLVSFPLRFHPVTRHDGTVSVMRGFTASELQRIVRAGAGVEPVVRRRLGYRLTARWTPRRAA